MSFYASWISTNGGWRFSYRISWSATSVLVGFAFIWLCSYNASAVRFLEKDFVVLWQETGMFAVPCVSLTIFPVYSSRKTMLFSFLDIYFLRILLVLPSLWIALLKNAFFCFKWIQANYEILNHVAQKILMLLLDFKMSVSGWIESSFTFHHLWVNLEGW